MKINATEVAKMTNMKWIATLILLIVSLAPLAVAEENQTDTGSSDTGSDEKTDDSVDAVDIADKIVVSRREMVKDRVQEVRDGVKGMREEAQNAREIRTDVRAQFKSRREEIQILRDDLRTKCEGKQQTEECKTARKEGRVQARDVLRTAVDEMVAKLKEARDLVAASDLKAEEKAKLTAELDAKIAEADAAGEESATVTEEAKADEVKKAVDKVRKSAQETKRALRNAAHELVAGKLKNTLRKADQLGDRLEKVLAHMEKKGVDTSGINVEAFDAKVDEAESLYAEAQKLMEQAKAAEPGQKDELMKQATEKLRASHNALKEAGAMLRDLVRQIKGKDPKAIEQAEQPESDDADEDETESDEADDADEAAGNETESDEDESEDDSTVTSNTSASVSVDSNGTTITIDATASTNTTVTP
ncbi:MAG TPA: hypothetical protein VI612_01515 [Candidatus Nanoarchaeia archaeon]|nr:hypothetical protein [Candidatus Nanoarchaeia archaeon]